MLFISLMCLGFVVAFIGTLAGSGGLIGMPALMLLGVPVHGAIATAKFSNMFSSFSSFYVLLKKKELIFYDALKLIPFAIGGGFLGGLLTSHISGEIMNFVAIILLSGAFVLSLLKKPIQTPIEDWKPSPRTYPYLFGISMYDGMFGPGQATMLMYTFLLNGASFIKAMAFTRFQTFVSCFAAFFPYLLSGHFHWKIGIFFAAGSIAGAQTAVRIAPKISTKYLKWLLNAVTILLILQLLWKAFL